MHHVSLQIPFSRITLVDLVACIYVNIDIYIDIYTCILILVYIYIILYVYSQTFSPFNHLSRPACSFQRNGLKDRIRSFPVGCPPSSATNGLGSGSKPCRKSLLCRFLDFLKVDKNTHSKKCSCLFLLGFLLLRFFPRVFFCHP